MSKTIRSLICVVLSLVMLLAGVAVSAEEAAVQPRFSYTNYTATGLEITTQGVACCTANVEGYDGITTKVHIRMTLQKHNLLWWSDVVTWENAWNNVVGTLCRTTTVGTGRYRVKAVYTVYSGSNSEEITSTSLEKKITVS